MTIDIIILEDEKKKKKEKKWNMRLIHDYHVQLPKVEKKKMMKKH